jgi:DNA-directed RNA polymerase specialized sigma24 family protein
MRALGVESAVDSVIEDARLRWESCSRDHAQPDPILLIMITTRLTIERQRASPPRAHFSAGDWRLDPSESIQTLTPQQSLDRADDIAVATLSLLERVSPEARAALLLRGAFSVQYPEVAALIGQSEPRCRALVREAKTQLLAQLAR